MTQARLLDAAAGGNERAYAELVEPHRRLMHAHCYRMLASVQDAEDAVQDTLPRAWRSLSSFEGRSSFRSWLYTIATNVCLRVIERRPKRALPIDYGPPADPHDPLGPPLVESTWIEPYPDERFALDDKLAGPEARYEQRESIELAFIAALQHLPADPARRPCFSGAEVAESLATTPTSVYSALQRAHDSVIAACPTSASKRRSARSATTACARSWTVTSRPGSGRGASLRSRPRRRQRES